MSDETDYPGVEPAFDLAADSYDTIIKRLDAIDGRLQTIMAFAATTTAVVPTIAANRGVHFRSIWLYIAIGAFATLLGLGTWTRFFGKVRVLNPSHFYDKWLDKSVWQFKKDFIYFAGQDFADNVRLLNIKWLLTVIVSLLFFAEVAALVVWAAVAKA